MKPVALDKKTAVRMGRSTGRVEAMPDGPLTPWRRRRPPNSPRSTARIFTSSYDAEADEMVFAWPLQYTTDVSSIGYTTSQALMPGGEFRIKATGSANAIYVYLVNQLGPTFFWYDGGVGTSADDYTEQHRLELPPSSPWVQQFIKIDETTAYTLLYPNSQPLLYKYEWHYIPSNNRIYLPPGLGYVDTPQGSVSMGTGAFDDSLIAGWKVDGTVAYDALANAGNYAATQTIGLAKVDADGYLKKIGFQRLAQVTAGPDGSFPDNNGNTITVRNGKVLSFS